MRIKVIVPVFGFTEALSDIIEFYLKCLPSAKVIIVNTGERGSLELYKRYPVHIYDSRYGSSLKGAWMYHCDDEEAYDLVITNEHDVVPSPSALKAAIEAYRLYCTEFDVASVSCVYACDGEVCYPTNPAWFIGEKLLDFPHIGSVGKVGKEGVPFGFGVWAADVFDLIATEGLPPTVYLDSRFGALLHSLGYVCLRLLEHRVEHRHRGVKSWRWPNGLPPDGKYR